MLLLNKRNEWQKVHSKRAISTSDGKVPQQGLSSLFFRENVSSYQPKNQATCHNEFCDSKGSSSDTNQFNSLISHKTNIEVFNNSFHLKIKEIYEYKMKSKNEHKEMHVKEREMILSVPK